MPSARPEWNVARGTWAWNLELSRLDASSWVSQTANPVAAARSRRRVALNGCRVLCEASRGARRARGESAPARPSGRPRLVLHVGVDLQQIFQAGTAPYGWVPGHVGPVAPSLSPSRPTLPSSRQSYWACAPLRLTAMCFNPSTLPPSIANSTPRATRTMAASRVMFPTDPRWAYRVEYLLSPLRAALQTKATPADLMCATRFLRFATSELAIVNGFDAHSRKKAGRLKKAAIYFLPLRPRRHHLLAKFRAKQGSDGSRHLRTRAWVCPDAAIEGVC
ncbi:hypothetical protein C8Q77DRAFT_610332 [Trametes polyzona]|nr:hypothetical protein C8Q77DRAFT_610332 [Trametes polyzona]